MGRASRQPGDARRTYDAEEVAMPSGTYINSGNWLRGNTYVEIDGGTVTLKAWEH